MAKKATKKVGKKLKAPLKNDDMIELIYMVDWERSRKPCDHPVGSRSSAKRLMEHGLVRKDSFGRLWLLPKAYRKVNSLLKLMNR